MKKYFYITITFCLLLSPMFGQDTLKSISPFYIYYKSSGNSRGITQIIEIKNNGIVKYKLETLDNERGYTKTIKMDKKSFEIFKSQLVNHYRILELPREDLSCKTCMDGSWVDFKYKINNVNRDISANNPHSANKIFKEIEDYLFDVVGRFDTE